MYLIWTFLVILDTFSSSGVHTQLEFSLSFSHSSFFTPKVSEVNQCAEETLFYFKEEKIVWTLMLVLKTTCSLKVVNSHVIGGWGWLLSVNTLLVTPAASWQYLLHHSCFLIIHFQHLLI